MDKKMYAMFALVVASIVGVSGVSAFGGFGMHGNEDMKAALESGDYDAFIAAAKENVAERLTEERFDQMAERMEKANSIQQAIENGDYESWVAAVEAAKPPEITDLVNEGNFASYVEMQNAISEGDFDSAKEIAEELGIGEMRMQGMGHGGFGGMRMKFRPCAQGA